MKILVGNNRLADPGGSETYAYALVKELFRRGHEVHCVASGKEGMVSNNIKKLNIPIYFRKVKGDYDLALLSHSTSITLAEKVKAFKIQTCHGIYPKLEQPVKGVDVYVVISEEVANHLKALGLDSVLIRNGVDCDRFKSSKIINNDLNVILSLSHSKMVNNFLSSICVNNGWELLIKNKYTAPIWDVESLINKVDLVVALGRGAYESMACERNVLVFDQRLYADSEPKGDGMVTDANFKFLKWYNFSGRCVEKRFTEESLTDEITNGYHKENGRTLRNLILKEFNIKKQVDKYLNLVR